MSDIVVVALLVDPECVRSRIYVKTIVGICCFNDNLCIRKLVPANNFRGQVYEKVMEFTRIHANSRELAGGIDTLFFCLLMLRCDRD